VLIESFSSFASRHWIVGGLATSLLWFAAGKQSLSNNKAEFAQVWQFVAILIAVVVCVWAIVGREWIGLCIGVAVLVLEAYLMRHAFGARNT